MTLFGRIDYCLKLAEQADDLDTCDAYIAEATGLMGKPLDESLVKHANRYELGVRDRATRLKSPERYEIVPLDIATLLKLEELDDPRT